MQKWLFLIVAIVFLSLNHRSYAPPDFGCPPCELEVRIGVFERPGKIVFDRVPNAEFYYIQWAPGADGPWTNFSGSMGAWLDNIPAAGVGAITASVPMFYRVKAWVPTNALPDPAVMSLIPAGEFVMGDTFSEGENDELPLHTNYISAFYIDKYEVTKALWDEIRAQNGGNGYSYSNTGGGKATNHPVHTVNWYDAVKWCNARSEMEGLTPVYYTDVGFTTVYKTGEVAPHADWSASGYRLPTEAEWEKAARGGLAGQRFPWGDTISHSNANYYADPAYDFDVNPMWGSHPTFNDSILPYTSPVGYFAPNGYGLHDMTGNVWEWCWDWYSSSYYSSSPSTDPRGPSMPIDWEERVLRGVSWDDYAPQLARISYRFYHYGPDFESINIGFRCVRGL